MTHAEQFSVPAGRYFLSHSVGCLPTGAPASLERAYFAPWSGQGGDAWPAWLQTIEKFCSALGALFSTNGADICPQPSVSAGFSNYLASLPKGNRRKVVMHADAFPTMGFAVRGLTARNMELVLIEDTLDADDPNVWAEHLGPDVLACLITHVHSNTGIVSPVADIATLCREAGAYSVVDVAQSAGIVPVSPVTWGVDALVGSCVKWLCGGPGAGYLWMSAAHAATLEPEHIGWFSHEDPFEFDIRSFKAASSARRFWGGTPSIAPYALALGALGTLGDIGFLSIREHNLALKLTAMKGLEDGPWLRRAPDKLGGTLCLTFDDAHADEITQKLTENQCRFDRRDNTVRLSLHIYNTPDDAAFINDLLRALD